MLGDSTVFDLEDQGCQARGSGPWRREREYDDQMIRFLLKWENLP